MSDAVPDDHEFALLLTHDVDRPYKTYQSLFYAVRDRDPYHLKTALPGRNPYWTFDDVMAMEEDLGVRSSFYFLDEQRLFGDRPVRDWMRTDGWRLYAGRYSLFDPDIVDVMHRLDDGDWEVGLHGSYESYREPARLRAEKDRLEAALSHEVRGGRQHYLNLDAPTTWRYHRDVGLQYDATPGSSSTYGFQHGYDPLCPFDDEFVVFPLTVMEVALPDPGDRFDEARSELERLLAEADENDAVMSVLWHPRYFARRDFPGYVRLYRWLVERALEMGAWVGPAGDLYERLQTTESS